jgi:hypothetical protein
VVDVLMGLRSSPSNSAMTESIIKSSSSSISAIEKSRIISNFLRCWTASESGEVFVIVLRRTGDSALLNNACSMLLLKVVGRVLVLVLVLCVCGGDFMVVVDKGL